MDPQLGPKRNGNIMNWCPFLRLSCSQEGVYDTDIRDTWGCFNLKNSDSYFRFNFFPISILLREKVVHILVMYSQWSLILYHFTFYKRWNKWYIFQPVYKQETYELLFKLYEYFFSQGYTFIWSLLKSSLGWVSWRRNGLTGVVLRKVSIQNLFPQFHSTVRRKLFLFCAQI